MQLSVDLVNAFCGMLDNLQTFTAGWTLLLCTLAKHTLHKSQLPTTDGCGSIFGTNTRTNTLLPEHVQMFGISPPSHDHGIGLLGPLEISFLALWL